MSWRQIVSPKNARKTPGRSVMPSQAPRAVRARQAVATEVTRVTSAATELGSRPAAGARVSICDLAPVARRVPGGAGLRVAPRVRGAPGVRRTPAVRGAPGVRGAPAGGSRPAGEGAPG